jgi:S-adenosylmethionine-dependent methyltransferase
MRGDVNFDGIAAAFEAEIYGSSQGRVRLAVLWADLLESVPGLASGGLSVLDAGGGAGHLAIRLARLGHQVVLSDPSGEMLDLAAAAITAAGVTGQVSTVRAGLQELPEVPGSTAFDVVACHAVLEWLADPGPSHTGTLGRPRSARARSVSSWISSVLAWL